MEVANGAAGTSAQDQNGQQEDSGFKLKFATVCASNQNRYAAQLYYEYNELELSAL